MKFRFLIALFTLALMAGFALLPTTGCSELRGEVCACEVVFYDADCQVDPSAPLTDIIDHGIVNVECPSGLDGGIQRNGPGYDQMEKQAKEYVRKRTGMELDPPSYNPQTNMISFIKVLGCKQFVLNGNRTTPEPQPSKNWYKKMTKKFGKMAGADCSDIDVDDDAMTYTVYDTCDVEEFGNIDGDGTLNVCQGPDAGMSMNCTPDTTPAGSCSQCMATKCCDTYNACVGDPTICGCLMACSDTGDYVNNCSGQCVGSSLAAAQARQCLACASVCPAIQSPPQHKVPHFPDAGAGGADDSQN